MNECVRQLVDEAKQAHHNPIMDADWRPVTDEPNSNLQRDFNALAYSYRVALERMRGVRRMDRFVDQLFNRALFLFVFAVALLFLTGGAR